MTTTIQISHKIEIASPSNKFKTYCRKAFGISRFAYNWALGKIIEQREQAIASAYKITGQSPYNWCKFKKLGHAPVNLVKY